jgi:hypothetical protein
LFFGCWEWIWNVCFLSGVNLEDFCLVFCCFGSFGVFEDFVDFGGKFKDFGGKIESFGILEENLRFVKNLESLRRLRKLKLRRKFRGFDSFRENSRKRFESRKN